MTEYVILRETLTARGEAWQIQYWDGQSWTPYITRAQRYSAASACKADAARLTRMPRTRMYVQPVKPTFVHVASRELIE